MWWSGWSQDGQSPGPAWVAHRDSQNNNLLSFPKSSRGGRAGCCLSTHPPWMDQKLQHFGRSRSTGGSEVLPHWKDCIASLISSPKSCQTAAGMLSSAGSGCSPGGVVAALVSADSWKSALVTVLPYNGPVEDCHGWMWVMEDLFRSTALNVCFQLREGSGAPMEQENLNSHALR